MAYTPATVADLQTRYPAFAGVADARVQYWLDDARERVVLDGDWIDPDGPIAQMLVAAHELTMGGDGVSSEAANLPAGVTQMKSGTLSLSFDSGTVAAQAAGGWMATKYGAQFYQLLKLKKGGIRVTSAGTVPACRGGWRQLPFGVW